MSFSSKLIILILVLTLGDQAHTGNIYGGHEAVPHSRPYMASLKVLREKDKTYHCSAFLLNEDFIMTAAHCQAKSYTVLLGVHNIQRPTNAQVISVEESFPHKDYNATDYSNDIMLLKLSTKAHLNKNVTPIPLADKGDGSLPKACVVSGWGRSDKYPNKKSPVLMEVNVTLIDGDECFKERSYCSMGKNGPRQGDSGSPLVCEDGKAFGVMSAGRMLDTEDQQIYAYTKIPDYREWIISVFKEASKRAN